MRLCATKKRLNCKEYARSLLPKSFPCSENEGPGMKTLLLISPFLLNLLSPGTSFAGVLEGEDDPEEVATVVSEGLDVDEELLRALTQVVDIVTKLDKTHETKEERRMNVEVDYPQFYEKEKSERTIDHPVVDMESDEVTVNSQLLKSAEIKSSEAISVPSNSHESIKGNQEMHLTASNVWFIAQSTWQKIMRYMQDEKSLSLFNLLFPVQIIDHIFSLGDKINLVISLAKKLDPDFSLFLASEITPYLGPLGDFESFCNFGRYCRMGEIYDHLSSVGKRIHTMSYMISKFIGNSATDEALGHYIESTASNNTEFHMIDIPFHSNKNTDAKDRRRRTVQENFVSGFTGHTPEDYQEVWNAPQDLAGTLSETGSREGDVLIHPTSSTGFEFQEPQFESHELLSQYGNRLSRQGYGVSGYGSGYGGGYVQDMSVFNPYIIMGSLALGLLLGFVVLPVIADAMFSSVVERVKRDVQDLTQRDEVIFPPSLTSLWTSDPVAGDDFTAVDEDLSPEDFEEADIADFLNGLWRIYRDTNESSCVHYHLCGVLANSTTGRLTGKDSGMVILMSSVSSLMGVVGSGQLIDDVTQTVLSGSLYSCPSITSCGHL
ncbi:uncharacterized protein [Penaeus vannamei]|uniref:uncharacterized protein n=1 Tax=Penaeus vannamei TaxID=6689 RepID=UPI00387F6AC5